MEIHETPRSLIHELVCRIDDEAGVPAPSEVTASLQTLRGRLGIPGLGQSAGSGKGLGGIVAQPVLPFVQTLLNGLMNRAVIALFGPEDTRLTAAEIERLRNVFKEVETDTE